MRITKQRTLAGLILAVLMALPLCSILSRVIYVQSNKNAYQSYSNETYEVETKVSLNNFTNAIYNQEYVLNTSNVDFTANFNQASYFMEFSNADWTIPTGAKFFTIGASIGHTDHFSFTYYDNDKNYISLTQLNESNTYNFVLISATTTSNAYYTNSLFGATLETFQYVITQQKLDNVFEYSVSQFVEDNNFGKVDLTSWFMDMFLTDNVHNNLYVHFVNWYLNYVMLITLMHFLFAVLMWFINYCRRLLDRGMNYDW